MSTAEAELNTATLAWQIVEGVQLLISDLGVQLPYVKLLIDNKAALTIARCRANWRTRYFAVRAHCLHEEHTADRAILKNCKTALMLADALTKLAAAPVISTLYLAMNGGSSSDTPLVSSALVDKSGSGSSSPSHSSVPFVKN